MKYCIGPMSKIIVDTIINYSTKHNIIIGLIPSRRQVEYCGGYVNNWNTFDFSNYIKENAKNIILIRDHGGPNQGNDIDDGIESMLVDSVCFNGIHIDIWKKYKSITEAIESTYDYIIKCLKVNKNLFFEVGTEQSIRKYEAEDLDFFLTELKLKLKDNFDKIKYAVIQCGTSLQSVENTGTYDKNRLKDMVEICKKHNILSKEHNGDYISQQEKNEKFDIGLNCINIAPEFGVIETCTIINHVNKEEFDTIFNICLESKKWVKWVDKDFNPHENKLELIKITGHYVRSHSFIENIVITKNLTNDISNAITTKLDELYNKTDII